MGRVKCHKNSVSIHEELSRKQQNKTFRILQSQKHSGRDGTLPNSMFVLDLLLGTEM